jgi:putative transposase
MDRKLPSKPSSLTVIKNPDMTFEISFVVEKNVEKLNKTNKSIGLDVGLKSMITGTDSDNNIIKIGSEKHLKKLSKKLAKNQKVLSRKKEYAKKEKRKLIESKNYQKQKVKVAKIHSLIARKRKDDIDKLTFWICALYDNIAIEDLNMNKLKKSRTKELKSNKAKQNINRTYGDVSLGLFLSKLKEKASMYNKNIVLADKNYKSTRICNNCNSETAELGLRIRKWTCGVCNTKHDRDINASINLLKLADGQSESINACGESISPITSVNWLFSKK